MISINGYNNYTEDADNIDLYKYKTCGYNDIYALWSKEKLISDQRLFYYMVDIDLDKCLETNFLMNIMDIKL